MADRHELGKRYTWQDYRSWTGDRRVELIHGEIYDMSPAPKVSHQFVAFETARLLTELCEADDNCECRILMSPVDVRLFESDDDTDTVVQPDVLAVCDPDQIDAEGIRGAPDLVVEVTSPATSYRDHTTKLRLYEEAGVREYWIINAEGGWIMVYRREDAAETTTGETPGGSVAHGTGGNPGAAATPSAAGFAKPDYYRTGDRATTRVGAAETLDVDRILQAAFPT
jgi:Uma2 family endonuclease